MTDEERTGNRAWKRGNAEDSADAEVDPSLARVGDGARECVEENDCDADRAERLCRVVRVEEEQDGREDEAAARADQSSERADSETDRDEDYGGRGRESVHAQRA